MSDNLEKGLKDHYGEKKLSSERIQKLMDIQERKTLNFPSFNLKTMTASLVTACLVLFAVNFFSIPVIEKIAKEVRYNHLKNMPAEVLTKDYNVVNAALDRLDFEARANDLIPAKIALAGGRYCSIQGKIAAQLHYVDKAGNRYTLYQFKLNEELDSVIKTKRTIGLEDTEIMIWKSSGLGYALASDR
jgi:anti-sigma factor RsiW